MKKFCSTLLFSLLFTSCIHYIDVARVTVDKTNLASTFARSPDPAQSSPPTGEKLYSNWRLPPSIKPEDHHLVLSVIYKDLTEETQVYPLAHHLGITSFALTGQKFTEKSGFHAYKVELLDKDDNVIDKYEHRMWVNLIH